ncbi:MAG: hypothetical protein KBA07_10990 [Petrotogaceae bacterium]|nr:hypothetical protein [Petrotogaceae bacterium]
MVFIVTGEINSGKSTLMENLYNFNKEGGGIITKKKFCYGTFLGYDLYRLDNQTKVEFALYPQFIDDKWEEVYRFGPFSFSKKGLIFFDNCIQELINREIQPVFIDEAGPAELEGKLFFMGIKKVLHSGLTLYITVRSSCLEKMISVLAIKDFQILKIEKGGFYEVKGYDPRSIRRKER